jgi:hypothetical protein
MTRSHIHSGANAEHQGTQNYVQTHWIPFTLAFFQSGRKGPPHRLNEQQSPPDSLMFSLQLEDKEWSLEELLESRVRERRV